MKILTSRHSTIRTAGSAVFVALALAACATGSQPEDGANAPGGSMTVSGNVTYRPRIALPPDAVVHVVLEDVSRADAPPTTVAEASIKTDGRQVPIPFSMDVDRDKMEAGHNYALRARILDNAGTLMWTMNTAHPVAADSAVVSDLELVVVQVDEEEAGDNRLGGSSWQLMSITSLDGKLITPPTGEGYTIAFDNDGRFNGQADCNRYGGEYTVQSGDLLKLERGLSTLAACAPPSSANDFMNVMNAVTAFEIMGDNLKLTTAGGALEFRKSAGG